MVFDSCFRLCLLLLIDILSLFKFLMVDGHWYIHEELAVSLHSRFFTDYFYFRWNVCNFARDFEMEGFFDLALQGFTFSVTFTDTSRGHLLSPFQLFF